MRVLVVGAGVSGLTCAFRLQRAGCDVTVAERSPTVGGRMSTVDAGGFAIDVGTNILLDNYTRTKALARELGLDTQWMPLRGGAGGILRDGRLSSFDPGTLTDIARYPGLSPSGRARVLRFLLTAWPKRRGLDFFDLSVGDDAGPDTRDAYSATVEACGAEVAEYLVDPFVRTFHFHSARGLSMKYFDALAALFLTDAGFETRGFRGAMRALPNALASRLLVIRGAAVKRVERRPKEIAVTTDAGDARYDAVVLAIPAQAALAVLAEPTPEERPLLAGTRYSSTLVCSYRVPAQVLGDFEGIWVPRSESWIVCDGANERRKGCFDGVAGVLTVCLHEEAAVELARRSDDEILRCVGREWARLFPAYEGHLHGIHVQRWNAALPVYGVGHIQRVKRFWASGQGAGGVWLCGDYLNHPWVEGSVRCGEKVAAGVAAAIRPRAAVG